MNRLHLNTTFPVRDEGRSPYYALPVLVDLNWFGQTMTSPNAGIIYSPVPSITLTKKGA